MLEKNLYGPKDTKLDTLEEEIKTLREQAKESFEYHYLNIVNLTRIRIAERILHDCLFEDAGKCVEMSKILQSLDAMGECIYKKLRVE